ncbi:MAG: transcriptional regulator NrdR, partial [Candidatus Paceibacterota bacterium]
MICPFCSAETKVIDKRDVDGITRRRRECLNAKCVKRFTTYERTEISLKVIKKDNRREDFSRDKLSAGITRACEKRPVSTEDIEKMLNEIESRLRGYGTEIRSSTIGELVMNKLRKIDKIAYVRFASVYKDF